MVNGDWSSPCHHPLLPLPLPATRHFISKIHTHSHVCPQTATWSFGSPSSPAVRTPSPRHLLPSHDDRHDKTRQGTEAAVRSGLFVGWLAGWVNNFMITCMIVRASIKLTLYDTVATFESACLAVRSIHTPPTVTRAPKKGKLMEHDTTRHDMDGDLAT